MKTKMLFEVEFKEGLVFVTCKDFPGLSVSEKTLPDALRRAGDEVFKLAAEAFLKTPPKA